MIIYHYHPITGEFITEGIADADPLVPDNWLIPAHSTTEQPPPKESGKAIVFENGSWKTVLDLRGTVYYLPDGSAHKITAFGKELPEGALLEKPEPTPEQLLEQAYANRAAAYSNSQKGSDKFFAEAARKRAAGDEQGAALAEQQGLARVAEIKAAFPLPAIGE